MEIEHREETKLLETRQFRLHCGCTLERILPALGTWRDKPEELFQQPDLLAYSPGCDIEFRRRRSETQVPAGAFEGLQCFQRWQLIHVSFSKLTFKIYRLLMPFLSPILPLQRNTNQYLDEVN